MNKKYLFVIPRLGGGGAERVMVTIANQLCKRNEIKIATLTAPGSFYKLDERVEIVCLDCPVNRSSKVKLLWTEFTGLLKSSHRLTNLYKEWKPDTVLSFLQDTNLIVLFLKMTKRIKARIVVSERADPQKRGKVMQWLEKHWYPKADAIVCQSKPVVDFFAEDGKKKAVVIFNPISADAIPPYYEGERRKVIVGVGRLMPQKNFALLIDSFARIADKYPEYSVEIYGNGFLEDTLTEQIERLHLEKRVYLMGMKENVMHLVADATMFVLSTDFEGFPNALIEAMATGLPVITTDFTPKGVAGEIVKESNGFVVPVRDEAALAKAMETLICNEPLRQSMGENNRNIMKLLNAETVAAKWEQILDGNVATGKTSYLNDSSLWS